MESHSTDCREDVGITVGLIDGLIAIIRVLRVRDLGHASVQAALSDLRQDEDLSFLLSLDSVSNDR